MLNYRLRKGNYFKEGKNPSLGRISKAQGRILKAKEGNRKEGFWQGRKVRTRKEYRPPPPGEATYLCMQWKSTDAG